MKKITMSSLIFFGSCCTIFAQTEPSDVAVAKDEFQELFFESLLQKGIENYDKAIVSLEKCLDKQPNNAVLYNELGKNFLKLKDYKNAYESFEKATKIEPNNKWFWLGMYDVCYETRDFEQAIIIANKLITFKSEYKEHLVSLYMNTQQFDKALELINELNDKVGRTEIRDSYKYQILKDNRYQVDEKKNLIDQIKKNPKEESNYLALIYLYSKNNQDEKAQEIAEKLAQEIPNSDWAQVSLFKFYLNDNKTENAIKAMNTVLASSKIENKIKHRMLNEFLVFTIDKPQYDADLEKAISYFKNDKQVAVAKEIGKFYHKKNSWTKATKYYEIHLSSATDDLETVLLLLEVYSEQQQFETTLKKATQTLQIFPSQPELYFYSGLAYNQLADFKNAKEQLETGLDFVVNNIDLEIKFYILLTETYKSLGNETKENECFAKTEQLIKQRKLQNK